MKRLGAAAGFFVARRFTRSAVALAKQSPKVVLCPVRAADVESWVSAFEMHAWHFKRPWTCVAHCPPGVTPPVTPTVAVLHGRTMASQELAETFMKMAALDKAELELGPVGQPAPGVYTVEFGRTFLFPLGALFVDSAPVKALTFEGTAEWHVIAPKRIVSFAVEGRGRTIQFICDRPDGEEITHFVAEISKPPDDSRGQP
jgi:hypothetical protein